jgi:hypothetical protein
MPFLLELELKDVRLRGHDHYWDLIRNLGKGGEVFTLVDVVGASNAHKATIGDFVKRLVRAGILETAGARGEGRWSQKAFRLLESPRETPSLRRDGEKGDYGRSRQQMWNVIRGPQARDGIAGDELAMLAATDDVSVALPSAKEFLQRLEKAGYLTVIQKAANNRLTRYRLKPSMNSGPLAPKLLRARIIYDPNNRTIVGSIAAEEVAS